MGNGPSQGQATVTSRWRLECTQSAATGRMQEVAQEMIHYKTDIMVLQEMRWPVSGGMDIPEFAVDRRREPDNLEQCLW
jgi:hypothetical protein